MRRDLTVLINNEPVACQWTVDGGSGQVTIAGRRVEVDCRSVGPSTWSVIIDRRSFLVDFDVRKGKHAVLFATSVGVCEVRDTQQLALASKTQRAGVAVAGERVNAPIAGKVVKIHVEVGQVVAAGTPILVLEAMKMENELCAEKGGTVAAIRKRVGDLVDSGELVVELT